MLRTITDKQYKSGTKLQDANTIYLVNASIDLHWLTKDETNLNKYLTTITKIGIIEQTTTGE